MKIFNLVVAAACFMAYMYQGIKFDGWRRGWYMAVFSALNLWAAVYLN